MIGAATVLEAFARYWPLVLGSWLASCALVAVFVARAGRTLNRDPQWSRCVECQGLFVGRLALAQHILDRHPALMPRVDA